MKKMLLKALALYIAFAMALYGFIYLTVLIFKSIKL